MKKKCTRLALCSFAIALAIFVFSFILYHYGTAELGFSALYRAAPAKPMVTLLFAIWGTHFLFAGVISLLIGRIFFKEQ